LRKENYQIGSSVEEIMSKTDISFVCVNTPTDRNSQQDLSQIMLALHDIAAALNVLRKYHLIVFRSTVLPGTMKNIIVDYLERNCKRSLRKDYDVCYNPEFLRQYTALEDFLNPDRVVIGEDRKGSSLPVKQIYQDLTNNNIIITSFETAEMIKYVSNCFLSLKISFFNEIAMICRQIDIDDKIVSLAVSLDKRIGKYGTEGGRPFAGPCLPKDTEAMAFFVKKLQANPDLLEVALDINRKIEQMYYWSKPVIS
jgi:nucleotide sugar dehydrogenase